MNAPNGQGLSSARSSPTTEEIKTMQPTRNDVREALNKLMAEVDRLDAELQARVQYIVDLMSLLQPRMARLLKYGPVTMANNLSIRHTGKDETEIAVYETRLIGCEERLFRCEPEYIAEHLGAEKFGTAVIERLAALHQKYAQINQQDAHIPANSTTLEPAQVGPST